MRALVVVELEAGNCPRRRVERALAGHEDKAARLHPLTITSQGLRCFVGVNNRFGHFPFVNERWWPATWPHIDSQGRAAAV